MRCASVGCSGVSGIASDTIRPAQTADRRILARSVCRFTALATLSENDLGDLATLAGERRSLRRGDYVCHEGDPPGGLYLLNEGWTASSITFASGARQLLKVHLPGDVIGMPSLALRQCADTVTALTPAELSVVSRQAIGHLFEISPRLAAILFLISQEERTMMMDRLAAVGATDAVHSLAALMLQVHARIVRSEPDTGHTFYLPLSQENLADLIGVTTVHLNRTLQTMRLDGLLDWGRHSFSILDYQGLVNLAGIPVRTLDRNADWLPAAPGKHAQ